MLDTVCVEEVADIIDSSPQAGGTSQEVLIGSIVGGICGFVLMALGKYDGYQKC